MVLEKLLEITLECKEIKSVNPKGTDPEYSLERLMFTLKLQFLGHLMGTANSLKKSLMLGRLRAGGEGDDRGLDGWMASLAQWT